MNQKSDPRVFFAAERTLLAWLRTGITIIALGFVVSRFGLFLRILSIQSVRANQVGEGMSAILGMVFVLAGALSILMAAIQHRRYIRSLPSEDLPEGYSTQAAIVLSAAVAASGILLAGYLFISRY
ncbi:MAG: DUF202 domain-containing protein [Oxalobacter sp.]|nr:MAG: DUF202 domain-containing protein [Oxalobacter sp.]